MLFQVGIDMSCFPGFQSDVDFTEKLVVEQSVFALPASVSIIISTSSLNGYLEIIKTSGEIEYKIIVILAT